MSQHTATKEEDQVSVAELEQQVEMGIGDHGRSLGACPSFDAQVPRALTLATRMLVCAIVIQNPPLG